MKRIIKAFIHKFDKKGDFFRDIPSSAKILDIGCGRGYNGIYLKTLQTSCEVYGIDILPDSSVPDFYIYKNVDLDKGILPYPDDFFDIILFTHVIEHLYSPLSLGKEINRVMKKQAKIYIETPNWTTMLVPSFGFHREQHNPFNFFDDPTHVRPWSKHGIFEFLYEGCSLYVEKVGTVRNWLRVPQNLVRILNGLITGNRSIVISSFWNVYGWCIYAIGRKE
jgi:SAM-dependent methyltransferase